jgi:hypothetical protein
MTGEGGKSNEMIWKSVWYLRFQCLVALTCAESTDPGDLKPMAEFAISSSTYGVLLYVQ